MVFWVGYPAGGPQPLFNATLLVDPVILGSVVIANGLGFGRHPLPLPASIPAGVVVDSQWMCLTNAVCPGSGLLSASERLRLTTF